MAEPWIDVLGVYRVRPTDERIRELFELFHGTEHALSGDDLVAAERYCREFIEATVLIEAVLHNRDGRFDMDDFTQPDEIWAPEERAPAFGEAVLTSDGMSLADSNSRPENGDLRIAFFMQCWNASKPLQSSYGDIWCPTPVPMPERLERLVPHSTFYGAHP
jgi:hypothetical protein